MTAFEKIFNKISDNRFYVEYINKEDGRNGEGYYVKTREEAEMFLRDLMRKYFPHNEIKYIV